MKLRKMRDRIGDLWVKYYPITIQQGVFDVETDETLDVTLTKKADHGYDSAPKTLKEVDEAKVDKTSIVGETGQGETSVMHQKAVTDEIAQLAGELQKVWEFLQIGYWVHKDTGVKTYFGLDDPSIENGIMGYPSWMPDCSEVKLPSGVTGFKTYNWSVMDPWTGEMEEFTYTGFVYSKETYSAGNDVLIGVDLSNTSITSISQEFFVSCYALTSITIPESVTSLGDGCFSSCASLTSITIPESVTSLGDGCFSGCSSLTSITIPESVTSLEMYCFYYCSSLTSITIPESVTSLEMYCFSSCTSLTSITIPESVTSLGDGCFSSCTSLTSITIPESVTSLEMYCFSSCTSLTSITIPESVTSLRDGCFSSCTSLTSITIPESVTSLRDGCFSGCSSLILATVLPAIPPSLGWYVFGGVHTSFNIKVRSPYVDDYKTATNWNEYADKISAI